MSTISGYFDETILNDIRATAASMMLDDRIKQQFIPQYDILKAIQAVQTAKSFPVPFSKKQVDVELIWENACGIEPEDNTTCVIGGNKLSTNKKEYSLTYEKVVNFSVDEADSIDNEFEINTLIAKGFLRADKELTEAFAQYCTAQLELFRGVNAYTGGKGNVVTTETWLAAAYWDAALMAYFNKVGILNRFTNPVLLSGENLYEQTWVARANVGNADGKGDQKMYGSMPIYHDLFNIDTVLDPALKTYMLSQNSLAMASRNFNPDKVEVTQPFSRWTERSRFMPFKLDCFYTTECTTDDLIQHNYKVKLKADLFRNPTSCVETNTGILSFRCGTV